MNRGFTTDKTGTWIEKGPNETLDYWIDWPTSDVSLAEAIVTHVWTIPAGITKVSQVDAAHKSTVFLSGGTLGARYVVSCRATTNSSPAKVLERAFTVRLVAR